MSPIFHPVVQYVHLVRIQIQPKIQDPTYLDQHHRGRLCIARLPDVQYGSEDKYSYDTARVKNAAAVLLWLNNPPNSHTHLRQIYINFIFPDEF